MVGMVMAAGDKVDDSKFSQGEGVHNTFGDADVRLVGVGVFASKRIREVRVEDDGTAFLNDEEAALAKPPKAAAARVEDAADVCQEGFVFSESTLHGGSFA
jgi:hypothetical protein